MRGPSHPKFPGFYVWVDGSDEGIRGSPVLGEAGVIPQPQRSSSLSRTLCTKVCSLALRPVLGAAACARQIWLSIFCLVLPFMYAGVLRRSGNKRALRNSWKSLSIAL